MSKLSLVVTHFDKICLTMRKYYSKIYHFKSQFNFHLNKIYCLTKTIQFLQPKVAKEKMTKTKRYCLQVKTEQNKQLCLSQFQLGTSPPPPVQPPGKFFERANHSHPGKIFCLIPCPGAKDDG